MIKSSLSRERKTGSTNRFEGMPIDVYREKKLNKAFIDINSSDEQE